MIDEPHIASEQDDDTQGGAAQNAAMEDHLESDLAQLASPADSSEDFAETSDPGDTESNSHDNTVSSADGGAGYLQVSALVLGGYTSVQITIRDSGDDISFADHADGAFAVVTISPTAQRIALTGTIRRYTAIDWDFIGAGSGQSITFMVGIIRA